ncbi:uncharacterized protein si:dkey-250k15.4 isoform X2 [Xiphias gladius]|uniref:uncharacterized protein si:dkey-250k15.4 isoform X2 n=1 Tax=Xiphias gladius TaxID=8245 RepID=UPI001A98E9C8|nr:uncharacterized protein si:dkey-250k15.4 isoform X2 [Xiphias gladius]
MCLKLRIGCRMSHICGRALSDKEKILKFFNRQSETTDKKCCLLNIDHNKTDGQNKMKRLKTRKERSQTRGGRKAASKTKVHHHHYHHQSSRDMAHPCNCCHSSWHCPLRRAAQFPNVIPAAQEPSIITDSRLIGHHGLFKHEVKSVDIERLLSEQGKVEKSGQKAQEKNDAISHPSSTSHIPSPFSSNDLLGADTGEVEPVEKKTDSAINTHDDCHEKQKKISHGSDVTLGQRPQQQLHFSSGSYKSIFSSKHSSLDVVINKSKKLTPTVDRDNVKTLNRKVKTHMNSTVKHTAKNPECPVYQTEAHGLSPGPLQLSSSLSADSFELQHRRQVPAFVFKSVSEMAARLCDCLQFPLLRKRNLVAESREVLLKAMQEMHGTRLQENLFEEQRHLSFGIDLAKAVQDHVQEPTMIYEDELPTDSSAFKADTASQPCLDSQKTTSFKMIGGRHFNWKSSLQPHQSLERTAEWLTSPVDNSASLLDDILRPSCSPQFSMDFEPSASSASDHLFAPSPTSCWGEKASASQHWKNSFNRPKSKEPVIFDSFEKIFTNHSQAVRGSSCGPQDNDNNIQSFFPYQAQLPGRHSAEPLHFPQEQNPFETDRYSFAHSFSAQIHHSNQSNHFQPFSQFSLSSTCPPLRSHHTDMMHYPPSHMLERGPAPPFSLPSPEHWSFPPMKLY